MGLAFGTIFGIMDIEDAPMKFIKELLMREENYCIPIGVFCGAFAGLFASLLDNTEGGDITHGNEFKPLKQEDEVEV